MASTEPFRKSRYKFNCMECDYRTNIHSHFKCHQLTHPISYQFHCSVCEYKTNLKCLLNIHQKIHSMDDNFKCTQCKHKTKSGNILQLHQFNDTRKFKFSCTKCEYKTNIRSYFHIHESVHARKCKFQFTNYEYKTNKVIECKIHQRTHSGEGAPNSNIEPEHEANSPNLHNTTCDDKTNMENDSSEKKSRCMQKICPFKCTKCDYETFSKSDLINHEVTHFNGELIFTCSKCHYKTNVKSEFLDHNMKHTQEDVFHCHVCQYKTNMEIFLKIHERNHVHKKYFHCVQCNFKTYSESFVNQHKKIHHNGTKFTNLNSTNIQTSDSSSGDYKICTESSVLDQTITLQDQNILQDYKSDILDIFDLNYKGDTQKNSILLQKELNGELLNHREYDNNDCRKPAFCDAKINRHKKKHSNGTIVTKPHPTSIQKELGGSPLGDNIFTEPNAWDQKMNVQDNFEECNFKTYTESFVSQHKEMHHNGTHFTKLNSTNIQTGDSSSGDHNICTESNVLDQTIRLQINLEESKSENAILHRESQMNSSNLLHDYRFNYTGKFNRKELVPELLDCSEPCDDTHNQNVLQDQQPLTMELLDIFDLNYKSDNQRNSLLLQNELNGELLNHSDYDDNDCRKPENLEEPKFESNEHEYNSSCMRFLSSEKGLALHHKALDYKTNLNDDGNDLRTIGFKKKVYVRKCKKCDYETNSRCDLINHEVTHFNGEIMFNCVKCHYKTNVKSKFMVHELKHAGGDVSHCTKSPFNTNNEILFKVHVKNHNQTKVFHCTQCNYQTGIEGVFNRHKKKHSNGTIFTKPHSTSIQKELGGSPSVDNIFSEHNVWDQKINVQDNFEESKYENFVFYCDSCNFKTNDEYILLLHEMEHTGEITFHCSECSFYSRNRQGLTLHQDQLCPNRRI